LSLRSDMLRAAARAPKTLGNTTAEIVDFLYSQVNSDGGFRGRGSESDLYYTVFGLNCLLGLGYRPPRQTHAFLRSFDNFKEMDLVHLSGLVRCWANLPRTLPEGAEESVLSALGTYASPDGGYNQIPGSENGSVYGCFLAIGAYQDLGLKIPDPGGIARCLLSLRTPDGGFSNIRGAEVGSTSATAAATLSLTQLQRGVGKPAGDWLLARSRWKTGFAANPDATTGDLLSTAVALHALREMGRDLSKVKKRCLDLVNSLYDPRGGYRCNRTDEHLDVEHTFYGLLVFGNLSD